MISLKFPQRTSTEFCRMEVSTIPPRSGAWSMLDMREIKSEAFTNESESANCLVRTPVSRMEEAMVSAKCIKPVKIQTTISGFMKMFILRGDYITNPELGKTFLPQLAAIANPTGFLTTLITGPGKLKRSFKLQAQSYDVRLGHIDQRS